MNEIALFAGVGGGILGAKLLGWRIVCAVEIDDYCRRLLMRRQDDGVLEPFPIFDDIRTFDGRPWAGCVDCVTGGFPCQDISAAGRGAGIEGKQSGLWSEMARVIREVRPRYVLVGGRIGRAAGRSRTFSHGKAIAYQPSIGSSAGAKGGAMSSSKIASPAPRGGGWVSPRRKRRGRRSRA